MPTIRVRQYALVISISCLGLFLVVPYLIGEVLEADSLTVFLQHFVQPSRIFHHTMMLLSIPAFMLIGYLFQKQKNLTENLEHIVEKRTERLVLMNEKLGVVGKLTRHDARNKLSTITMNTFLIKQNLADDSEALKHLSEVESACGEVERIFDFARIYEELGAEELVYMNVEKAFEEAVTSFSDLHKVEVVNDCRGVTVLADSLLRQLFYNLIDNSLKHGEKVNQIRVHCEETEKNKMKLVYEDDGVGIPKAEKEKIFTEGYGKGTGYGLYLIKKMCEVYGWNVRETGKQGKGAQFTLTIPKMNENGKITYRLY